MLQHSHFQTLKIDMKTQTCVLKPYFLSVSQQSGKIYNKWLRVNKNGRKVKIKRLNLVKPSSELAITYEREKKKFVRELIDEMKISIKKVKEKEKPKKELTPRQQNVYDLLCQGKTTGQIAKILCIDGGTVSKQKNYIRNKGFSLDFPKKSPIINGMEKNLLGKRAFGQK